MTSNFLVSAFCDDFLRLAGSAAPALEDLDQPFLVFGLVLLQGGLLLLDVGFGNLLCLVVDVAPGLGCLEQRFPVSGLLVINGG